MHQVKRKGKRLELNVVLVVANVLVWNYPGADNCENEEGDDGQHYCHKNTVLLAKNK
jgi:hypothetical protein